MSKGYQNRSDKILVVLPTDHRIAAIDFPWEQGHALIARADPLSGIILNDWKSVVSSNSERIALPL